MDVYRYEWFDIDGQWVTIDGFGVVSPETARVLRVIRAETRG